MLKKRSRATTSKQGLMPDHLHQPSSSLPSPTTIYNNRPTTSSLFPSPRLFVGFSAKGFSDSEAAMSPTSILETKPFSAAIGNPFFAGRTARRPIAETTTAVPHSDSKHHPHHHHHPWGNGDSVPIGLGIVDALKDEETGTKSSKPESRMVLFGSQLKIQIPPIPPASISPTGSMASLPHSPIEFGIKTKDSVLGSVSSPGGRRSTMGFANIGNEAEASPRVIVGSLSASEMEMSEDYTCVIMHGPNPRTTHIFDNYIVESCSGSGFSASRKEKVFVGADRPGYPSDDFLSCCYACKKDLVKGKDIYMYRGEKAFCCRECRYQQMVFDEGVDMCPSEDL